MVKKPVGLPPLDEATRGRTACEAGLLLNEAIRELVAPYRMYDLTARVEEGPVDIHYLGAVRHILLTSIVVQVYRLKETRGNFLVPWLFSDAELRGLGFPPVEEFIGRGKWKFFEIMRHTYAGHPSARKATTREPGRIVAASLLGTAKREAGLGDLKAFLNRVVADLAPGVERTRDELTRRYPEVERFVKELYPSELEQALLGQTGKAWMETTEKAGGLHGEGKQGRAQ